MTFHRYHPCFTAQQRDTSDYKKVLTSQVFLKQDLLENFLEDVSVLHGRSGCLTEDASTSQKETNSEDL